MTCFNFPIVDGVGYPVRVAHRTAGPHLDRAAGAGSDAAENLSVAQVNGVRCSQDAHNARVRRRFGNDEMTVSAVIRIFRVKASDKINAAIEVDVLLREQTIRERTA